MLKKAQLVEIQWDDKQKTAKPAPGGKTVTVQFNPQTLKISFQNKSAGGDQAGGSSKQFVGAGTTKLSVELLFDTTQTGEDVRKMTEQVAFFMAPKDPKSKKPVPPGIQFEWGTFIFRGVVESMEETIDYFAEEGVPLRASISLSINRQDIEFLFGSPGARAADGAQNKPGSKPLSAAEPGESVQSVAGRTGDSGDWKSIAVANGIDDPLRLPAGTLLDTSVGAGAGVSAGAGFSAGASASAGLSAGAGASAGFSAGASADAGFSAGIGGGVGFSAGASAGFGASASAGISAGAGASAGFGGGASAGFGAGASAGFGASAGISGGFSAGAEAGFGAQAGFSAGAGASAGFSAGAAGGASGSAGASAQAGAFADADVDFNLGIG